MKKYHHCVKFTYPLSFQTRIPKVDQHTGGKWLIHKLEGTVSTASIIKSDTIEWESAEITWFKQQFCHLHNPDNITMTP